MSLSNGTSTSLQQYEASPDHKSGTRTSSGPLLARVVVAAAIAATGLEGIFRPMSNFTQSSTSPWKEVNPLLLKKVRELFDEGALEFFEDGVESRFSKSLISMLQVHRGDGILAIAEYLRSGAAKPDVTSETLRSIGDFDDAETLTARWRVLRDSLMDKSPMVRDGAILGFANLNDPKAIQVLAEAKMNEPLNELRKLIDKVLEQLNNIK